MLNNRKPKKIVLAYSGGLDTSIILKWLKETYRVPVVACYVNLGQKEDVPAIRKKAMKTGAQSFFAPPVQDEFVTEYLWPAVRANATYEHKYLLGTALARPLIAQKLVEVAKKVGADAVSHGATGKGNDQVRFELTFAALAPHLHVIAPWREWEFKGREDLIRYAQRHGIPVPVSKKRPYSSDENLWHISHEGGDLEDLEKNVPKDVCTWTVVPEKAPNKPQEITLGFEKGNAVSLNGKKMKPAALVLALNQIGGRHAIGRVDLVENRLVGLKSRGIYECPGATILYAAHRELESVALDRETLHHKELIGPQLGQLIYYGQWFSPHREAMQAFVDKTQRHITGRVKLKLYKGNVIVVSRHCPHSLYDQDWVTFEEDSLYDQKDATGFIHLFGLPLKMQALQRKSHGK
jgi:argininosuccinate synthase